MELKRIVSLRFCAVVLLLILINVLLFVRDNRQNGNSSRIYEEMVTHARAAENTATAREAALAGYRKYTAAHVTENTSEEEKETIKKARILLMDTADYVDNYQKNLDEKIKSCENQLKSSLFREKRSFEYLNLLKTRADMKKAYDQPVKISNGIWLEQLLDFQYTGFILLGISLLVVYSFFNEQKTGLLYLIRSSKSGRTPLFLRRVGILFLITQVSSALLYMATAVAAVMIHGGGSSITDRVCCDERYLLAGYGMSRLEYCIVLSLLAGFFCFVLSLLAWLVMSHFSNSNSGLIFFVILFGVEYLLYRQISSKSVLRFLKYINIAAFVDAGGVLSTYGNWGNSIWIISVVRTQAITAAVLTVVLFLLGFYQIVWRHPASKRSLAERLFLRFHAIVMLLLEKAPVTVKELYKMLISQKVMAALIILFWLAADIDAGNPVLYSTQMSYYKTFFDRAQGLTYGDELEDILRDYENEYEEFAASVDVTDKYGMQTVNYRRGMLEYLTQSVEYVKAKNAQGIDAAVLMPYEYAAAFGAKQKENQVYAALLCLAAAILLCSTFYSYEKKNGVTALIRTAEGRRRWCVKKYFALWLLIAVFTGMVYGVYYWKLFRTYHFQGLDLAAQSLEMFSDLPLRLSIREFLVIDIIVKIVLLFAVSVIISVLVSRLRYVYSMLAGFAAVVPQVIYLFGVTGIEKWSLCTYMAVFPAWNEGWQTLCYIVLAGLLTAGAALYLIKVLLPRGEAIK